jgi:chemotaxis protein CheX
MGGAARALKGAASGEGRGAKGEVGEVGEVREVGEVGKVGKVIELALPALLDRTAAPALAASLLAARGAAVRLNGASVQRLGGQCLQVLLAGCRAWAADGLEFVIAEGSAEFIEELALLGAGGLFVFVAAA